MDSFGCFIKAEREKKGISIEEISTATKINPNILCALESDRIEDLPAIAFVKGFIHNYAKYIGLDPKDVVNRYLDFISRSYDFIPEEELEWEKQQREGKIGFSQNKILIREKRISRKNIISISLILVLIFGIWFSWSIFIKYSNIASKDSLDITHAISSEEKLSEEAKQFEESAYEHPKSESKSESEFRSESGSESELIKGPIGGLLSSELPDTKIQTKTQLQQIISKKELIINTLDRTWIDIKIDDYSPYDIMLKPGEVIKLEAQSCFSLFIGNAGGVEITYEGEFLGSPGKSGEVVRLHFPQ